MHDLGRSDFDPAETAITPKTASTLKPAWSVKAGGAISTQAIVAGGTVYWGSWDGYEHASSVSTGKSLWRTQIGDETKKDCYPVHIGVASSATVATVAIHGKPTLVDFVGGGAGSYYALNARTGRIIWSHFFGSPKDGYFMWSSPAIYRGSMYIGVASIGDCPLVPGAVVEFNAATGAIQHTFATAPPGCNGATVWASPAIDQSTGDVYIATGNDSGACDGKPEPYAQAVLELTSNLSLISAWRIPNSQQIADSDFGATPTLFSARIHGVARQLVGVPNKNGIYYAFIRGEIASGPAWETARITTNDGMTASSAWDGHRLYMSGSNAVIRGRHCQASIRAVNPSTGAVVWVDCVGDGNNFAAVAAAPGTVWATAGSFLYGVRSSDGKILFRYQEASGAWYYAPAMFSGDALFIGSPDGWLRKFTPHGGPKR
jgi:outer membrane protein assembly factor BamB